MCLPADVVTSYTMNKVSDRGMLFFSPSPYHFRGGGDLSKRTIQRTVTHIDLDSGLHARRPLCGEYRQYAYGVFDGMAYWKPGWAIPPHVDCAECKIIAEQKKEQENNELLQSSWI